MDLLEARIFENYPKVHIDASFPAESMYLRRGYQIISYEKDVYKRQQSIRQVMSGDTSFVKSRRKIYSLRNASLANVVVRKFMFANKKRVIGILLSLSIGGCIFLCTTYMAVSYTHLDVYKRQVCC